MAVAVLTLTTPVRVGDLINGVTVASLDLVSFSVNFQGATAVFSVVLQEPTSGWTYTLTLTGTNGSNAWAAFQTAFPNFATTILNYLESNGLLPAGTVSA
jgi:hypothetical protein